MSHDVRGLSDLSVAAFFSKFALIPPTCPELR